MPFWYLPCISNALTGRYIAPHRSDIDKTQSHFRKTSTIRYWSDAWLIKGLIWKRYRYNGILLLYHVGHSMSERYLPTTLAKMNEKRK